jgi:peroxiredoxin
MKITRLSALLLTLALGTTAMAQSTAPAEKPAEAPKQQTDDHAKDKPKHADGEHKDGKKKDGEKKADDSKKAAKLDIGSAAPDFTLTDTEGKEHKLSDLTKAGKTVVLQWFNPGCPFVVKHYGEKKTFNDLAAKWKDKDVVFIAINSGAEGKEGAGKDASAKAKADWKIEYPILIDSKGVVGKAYGAKRTPEMFVIGKDGTIKYHGAIDNDDKADKPGTTNYVDAALSDLAAGKPVTTATTKPYGCSVKY